jgi:hypothetical protein
MSADAIIHDHRWLPHRLDAARGAIEFVRIDREGHRAVTFLEDQYFPADLPRQSVPVQQVIAAAGGAAEAPLHFIFHSSMALSTLAARLFDLPGIAMGLKEPVILNDLANLVRERRQVQPLIAPVLRLLGRPFGPGEAVVIKPGNVANVLMPALMAARPHARALCLFAPLETFLRSVAKKGMFGRVTYRRYFGLARRDGLIPTGFSDQDMFEQTDLQIAAMVWLNAHARFAQLTQQFGERMRTIDSERVLQHREAAIGAMGRHFALPLDPAAIVAGPLFGQHSKELGRAFDAEQRRREHDAAEQAHGEEIAMVAAWTRRVAEHAGVPMRLPAELLPA